jgi:hypothetical protein
MKRKGGKKSKGKKGEKKGKIKMEMNYLVI